MTIYEKIIQVQSELKAPKGKFNSFGKYKYRSAEDILEAVKPVIAKAGLYLNMTDDIVVIGDRIYLKATATVHDGSGLSVSSNGMAREPNEFKGMSEPQITGSASSYARKYALNGLFGIDESEVDPDHDNKHEEKKQEPKKVEPVKLTVEMITAEQMKKMQTMITKTGADPQMIKSKYKVASSKDLTKVQASQIIKDLEAVENGTYNEQEK
jgi:hypothetical protein